MKRYSNAAPNQCADQDHMMTGRVAPHAPPSSSAVSLSRPACFQPVAVFRLLTKFLIVLPKWDACIDHHLSECAFSCSLIFSRARLARQNH